MQNSTLIHLRRNDQISSHHQPSVVISLKQFLFQCPEYTLLIPECAALNNQMGYSNSAPNVQMVQVLEVTIYKRSGRCPWISNSRPPVLHELHAKISLMISWLSSRPTEEVTNTSQPEFCSLWQSNWTYPTLVFLYCINHHLKCSLLELFYLSTPFSLCLCFLDISRPPPQAPCTGHNTFITTRMQMSTQLII